MDNEPEQSPQERQIDNQLTVGLVCVAATALLTGIITGHIPAVAFIGILILIAYAVIPTKLWIAKSSALEIAATLLFIGVLTYYTAPFFHHH